MPQPNLIALLHGPDQPGLVARVAGWVFERGGNILHADQHRDMEAGVFFQRVEWQPSLADAGSPPEANRADKAAAAVRAIADKSQGRPANIGAAEKEFTAFAQSLGMKVRIVSS